MDLLWWLFVVWLIEHIVIKPFTPTIFNDLFTLCVVEGLLLLGLPKIMPFLDVSRQHEPQQPSPLPPSSPQPPASLQPSKFHTVILGSQNKPISTPASPFTSWFACSHKGAILETSLKEGSAPTQSSFRWSFEQTVHTALKPSLQKWHNVDPLVLYRDLDRAVAKLALDLHQYVGQNSHFENDIHLLSAVLISINGLEYPLQFIKGARRELWDHHRFLLLNGVIWSILYVTVFSHDLAVFGEKASRLTDQWDKSSNIAELKSWRMLTVEQLLVKAGLVQSDVFENSRSCTGLTSLLENKHSIKDSIQATITKRYETHNLNYSDQFYETIRSQVVQLYDEADEGARKSMHEARVDFIEELELFTNLFRNRPRFSRAVEKVITCAQQLALYNVAQSHPLSLGLPSIGELYSEAVKKGADQFVSKAPPCRLVVDGPIAFTVKPALIEQRSAHNVLIYHPAQVFIDAEPQGATENIEHSDPATEQLANEVAAVKEQFIGLSSKVYTFAGLYLKRNYPSKPHDWLSLVFQGQIRTIWDILQVSLFQHPFAAFGSIGEARCMAWSGQYYDNHVAPLPPISRDDNDSRVANAAVLLDLLGGPVIFDRRQEIAARADTQLLQEIQELGEMICSKILFEVTGQADEELEELASGVVEEAMLLAISMSVHPHFLQIYKPALNTRVKVVSGSTIPPVKIFESSAHLKEGFISFVMHPGLRDFGTGEEVTQTDMCIEPPIVQIRETPVPKEKNTQGLGVYLSTTGARAISSTQQPEPRHEFAGPTAAFGPKVKFADDVLPVDPIYEVENDEVDTWPRRIDKLITRNRDRATSSTESDITRSEHIPSSHSKAGMSGISLPLHPQNTFHAYVESVTKLSPSDSSQFTYTARPESRANNPLPPGPTTSANTIPPQHAYAEISPESQTNTFIHISHSNPTPWQIDPLPPRPAFTAEPDGPKVIGYKIPGVPPAGGLERPPPWVWQQRTPWYRDLDFFEKVARDPGYVDRLAQQQGNVSTDFVGVSNASQETAAPAPSRPTLFRVDQAARDRDKVYYPTVGVPSKDL